MACAIQEQEEGRGDGGATATSEEARNLQRQRALKELLGECWKAPWGLVGMQRSGRERCSVSAGWYGLWGSERQRALLGKCWLVRSMGQ